MKNIIIFTLAVLIFLIVVVVFAIVFASIFIGLLSFQHITNFLFTKYNVPTEASQSYNQYIFMPMVKMILYTLGLVFLAGIIAFIILIIEGVYVESAK